MAHFIRDGAERPMPAFPFLNLTVSGGHSQLVLVRSPLDMEVIGTTLDDAAGEAFDKGAKVMGLPYPGGPLVDRHAREGDAGRFPLPKPAIPGLDLSFSGIKTAFVALVQRGEREQPGFSEVHRADLCASLQGAIIDHLMAKTRRALRQHELVRVGIAGGVAANSGLRQRLLELGKREGTEVFIPPFAYCTDNAAMIAQAGLHLLEAGQLAPLDIVPIPRIH
jgi:N6-L-threonylcarbamoyladenine synthase